MIRLYVPHDLAPGAQLTLDEGQSRYLSAVMRQTVGDTLAVFNGRDGEWRASVATVGKRAVTLTALSCARPQDVGPDLDLVIALVKRGRLETIIEKAAELGARRVREGGRPVFQGPGHESLTGFLHGRSRLRDRQALG